VTEAFQGPPMGRNGVWILKVFDVKYTNRVYLGFHRVSLAIFEFKPDLFIRDSLILLLFSE
jgi:hypothetical protein